MQKNYLIYMLKRLANICQREPKSSFSKNELQNIDTIVIMLEVALLLEEATVPNIQATNAVSNLGITVKQSSLIELSNHVP